MFPVDPIGVRAHCRVDFRRDAFGLQQSALGAADEPQGALPGVPVSGRRPGRHRSRHVDLGRLPGSATAVPICLATSRSADAMYAPVCTRFRTYDVAGTRCRRGLRTATVSLPGLLLAEWIMAAKAEPQEIEELEVEF